MKLKIDKIPEDWEIKELCELVKNEKYGIVDGPFGTQLHLNEYVESGIPLVRVHNINEDGSFNSSDLVYISEKKFQKLKRSAVFPGDIIIAKTGSLGRVCIFPSNFEKGLIASSCAKISIDSNKIEAKYIFYFLLSELGRRQILMSAIGSTRPTVNLNHIKKIKIIFPKSSTERQNIIRFLSTVDQAIQKVDEIIAKTERLKKGLIQKLLTKGIGHKEFKDTEIGRIPREWEVVKLEYLIYDIKNGFASGKRDENGIVQVRMNNVTTDGRLIFDSYLKVPIPKEVDKFILRKGDFLFNNTNSIDLVGKSAIFYGAPFPCTFSNHFTRIRFREGVVIPELVLYYFILLWKKGYFKSIAIRHVGQAAVHTQHLLKLKIPLPHLSEQQKIVNIISTIDKKLELERKRKEKLERIKKGLLNDLLTGRKRINNLL